MQLPTAPVDPLPILTDRALAETALALIASHGDAALTHANQRVRASRDAGNVVNFCRYRQIERLIAALQRIDAGADPVLLQ